MFLLQLVLIWIYMFPDFILMWLWCVEISTCAGDIICDNIDYTAVAMAAVRCSSPQCDRDIRWANQVNAALIHTITHSSQAGSLGRWRGDNREEKWMERQREKRQGWKCQRSFWWKGASKWDESTESVLSWKCLHPCPELSHVPVWTAAKVQGCVVMALDHLARFLGTHSTWCLPIQAWQIQDGSLSLSFPPAWLVHSAIQHVLFFFVLVWFFWFFWFLCDITSPLIPLLLDL